jgi:hypothetical protein
MDKYCTTVYKLLSIGHLLPLHDAPDRYSALLIMYGNNNKLKYIEMLASGYTEKI